jgi:hypothetical protein
MREHLANSDPRPAYSLPVPPTPDRELEKRRWADGAGERLGTLADAAVPLRRAFEAGPGVDPDQRERLSSSLLGASAALTQWLELSRAPRGLRAAEAEMGATAGVYRNAAVTFSSLADADPDQHAARCAACLRLLDQGEHHVELFFSILRKKGLAP